MRKLLLLVVLAGALGTALIGLIVLTSSPSLSEVRLRADPIVDALYAFQRDHGKPPGTLDELVPSYLPRLPDPPRRTSGWRYETFGGDGSRFSLDVVTRDKRWHYTSENKEWRGNDVFFE